MDRTEFIVATSILLFGAYCIGFLSHWVVSRLSHVSKDELSELDRMAEALHETEEARDALLARQKTADARIAHAEADLQAAKARLSEAQHEADELRAFISAQNMGAR